MLVYLWAILLALVSFFYLCVCVDKNKNDLLAKIKILMTETLPDILKEFAKRICGEPFVNGINSIVNYICHSRNPII
jgi:hypothetical protein